MNPGFAPQSASISEKELQQFRDTYRDSAFTCRYPHCERASDGFGSHPERDKHEGQHRRDYRCYTPACAYSELGFATRAQLNRHNRKYHTQGYSETTLADELRALKRRRFQGSSFNPTSPRDQLPSSDQQPSELQADVLQETASPMSLARHAGVEGYAIAQIVPNAKKGLVWTQGGPLHSPAAGLSPQPSEVLKQTSSINEKNNSNLFGDLEDDLFGTDDITDADFSCFDEPVSQLGQSDNFSGIPDQILSQATIDFLGDPLLVNPELPLTAPKSTEVEDGMGDGYENTEPEAVPRIQITEEDDDDFPGSARFREVVREALPIANHT